MQKSDMRNLLHVLLYSTDLNAVCILSRRALTIVIHIVTWKCSTYAASWWFYFLLPVKCQLSKIVLFILMQIPLYTTEPISVTVMAKQTDTCTEKCIWSVNGHQQDDIDGSSNPCTFTLKLTTNVTSVKCILGNPIKAVYSISFENIHHSKWYHCNHIL